MFQGTEKATALVDELLGRANAAMMAALNKGAEEIYEESQKQVPKSLEHHPRQSGNYPPEPLAEGAFVRPASIDHLEANIVYPGPYAAAQEAGHMVYRRGGEREVDWQVTQYTTAGTKARYLEDAGKAVVGEIPEELAIQGHIAFGDLPGFRLTPQSMTVAGRREEAALPPAGEAGQIMQRESQRISTIPPTSLTEVPGGHPPTLQ